MPIVGFNFTKLHIEKTSDIVGKINITNNIKVKDVEKTDLGVEKRAGLKFTFEFETNYKSDSSGEKSVGKMQFEGEITYLGEDKIINEAEEKWKKDQQISKEFMKHVLDMALSKSNIEAMVLSDKVNLPPPIPLPKVNIEEKPKK